MSSHSTPIRVLLIEDDIDVAAGLGAYLERAGVIAVDFAYTVRQARHLATQQTYDVLILDVQLPDGDGFSLCRELKGRGLGAPVLFLTARGSLDDKLIGFEVGAIDYMVKPFAPAELMARVKALTQYAPPSRGLLVQVGEYSLDPRTALLTGPGGAINLHVTAVGILRQLMDASPGSVSKEELNRAVWGDDPPPSDPLRMHIYELRQVLTATFGSPLIRTVRGYGYRFDADNAS